MFQKGDKVFHKNLKWYGEFIEYDWASSNDAVVEFINDKGYHETRCVTANLLKKVEN